MTNKKNLKLILLSLVFVYSLGLQARMMKFDEHPSSSFIITLPVDSATQPLTDDELWKKAAVVRFPVGSAYIPYTDPGFRDVVKAVKNLKDSIVVSRLLVIRGSASPEGGDKNNARLAHQRAKALVKVLSKYISLPDSLVEERYINEDYVGLRRLIIEKPTAYSQQVLSILDHYKEGNVEYDQEGNLKHDKEGKDAQAKQALQRLNGGKTWRLLLRDYFPELRASRIVLFVSKKNSTLSDITGGTKVPADLQSAGKQAVTNEQASVDTLSADTLLTADCKSAVPPTGQDSLQVAADTAAIAASHPGLNIKTNLLYDIALFVPQFGYAPTPNLAIEYLPKSGHITPVLELTWSPWRNDSRSKTWIIHNLLLEGRYYIIGAKAGGTKVPADLQSAGKERASSYVGHYISIYANTGTYDLQFNSTKAYLADKWGKTYGFGIGWGYVKRFTPTSRWKWEANAALGYLHSDYDKYHDAESWAEPGNTYFNWHENPADYRRYKNHLNYWGLTRLGFSISYDLF